MTVSSLSQIRLWTELYMPCWDHRDKVWGLSLDWDGKVALNERH